MPILKYHEKKGNIFNYLDGAVLLQCMGADVSPVTELDRAIESKYHNYSFIKNKYPNFTWDGSPKLIKSPGVMNFILKQQNKEETDFAGFAKLLYQVSQTVEPGSRIVINRRSISNFDNWNDWSLYAGTIREILGLSDCEVIVFYETELLNVEIREVF